MNLKDLYIQKQPIVRQERTESSALLIRFDSLSDAFWYDEETNNPLGLGFKTNSPLHYGSDFANYKKFRNILSKRKRDLIARAKKEMSIDKDFLKLVYKAKSHKREFTLNKFGGNLSMPHYAIGAEKVFKRSTPGAKKLTLNLAFQVGTFIGSNYEDSFIKILKTVLMCQAMNIIVNIDMFDSDTRAMFQESYVIVNVASSVNKLNLKEILVCSHEEFFRVTLFNAYSAGGKVDRIGTFLDESVIIRDLSRYYDVIGGTTIREVGNNGEEKEMVSRILKIGLR